MSLSSNYVEAVKSHASCLNSLADAIHDFNRGVGWYDNPREDGTLQMLIVTEVAEMCEASRKNGAQPDHHIPEFPNEGVECADAIIRLLDYAAYKGFPIGQILAAKFAYNTIRVDHKKEARAAEGGKKY